MRHFSKVHEWALYGQTGILVVPTASALDIYVINRPDKVVYQDLYNDDTYERLL
jgi:hypothetical protein